MPDKIITLENLDTFKTKIEEEIAEKQDALPAVGSSDKDKYLHTNSSTGGLEWAAASTDNQTVKTSTVTFGANDAVQITAGSNVTVTGDASAKTITIAATLPSGEVDINFNDTTSTVTTTTPLTNITVVGDTRYNVQAPLTFDNTPTNNSTNPVTSAGIYNAVQDVREVAEGKSNSFLVSAAITIATIKSYNASIGGFYVYNATAGEFQDKKAELVAGDYDSTTLANATIFGVSTSDVTSTGYIVYQSSGSLPTATYYLVHLSDPLPIFKLGDNFYVLETNYPDRWLATVSTAPGSKSFYVLETVKFSTATSSALGVVKLGNDTAIDSTAAKTYPVQLNASSQMYVSVPWTDTTGMTNPMTTAGDIIYGGSSGTPTRLAKGTAGQVLTMNSGATAPEWTTVSSVPTVTISLSQVVSQDPLEIQLIQAQYDIFANNKQVIIDVSALGENTCVWNYQASANGNLYFSFVASGNEYDVARAYNIAIDTSTLIASYKSYYLIGVHEFGSFELTATEWTNLKTNHYLVCSDSTRLSLLDWGGIALNKLTIYVPDGLGDTFEYTCTLHDERSSAVGMFYVEENNHVYEIGVFYNDIDDNNIRLIFRCATVY